MLRRHFCTTLCALPVLPRAGHAQAAPRSARIALLGGSAGLADPNVRRDVDPLPKGLRERGWVEGRDLVMRAARELGLKVPQSVRVSADGVIE
jgi:hypothetical protein